jgi:hypothetical protein
MFIVVVRFSPMIKLIEDCGSVNLPYHNLTINFLKEYEEVSVPGLINVVVARC